MTGLPRGLAIVAGAADGPLAMLGSGASGIGSHKGMGGVVMTIGTSGAVRVLVDQPLLNPRERTWCYVLTEGLWVAGGAINNAGLAIEWVRRLAFGVDEADEMFDGASAKPQAAGAADGLVDGETASRREASFAALLREAGDVPIGAEGLIFVPYLSGERSPHWNPMLRGALHGLTMRHTRGHLARAAMESVAFCLAEVDEALCAQVPRKLTAGSMSEAEVQSPESGVQSRGAVRLTGGATQAPLWCQIVADVLGETIETLDGGDASALGAAILARAAIEKSDVLTLARSIGHRVMRYEPKAENHARYGEVMKRFRTMAGMKSLKT